MLYGTASFIFIVVCIMLMGIILLQSSKTGGMGAAMGGQAINSAFGGYGADVEVYLGDILIGTISSWDGAGQINYTIANTGSYYLRIVGGGPLQAIGYIDELYIQ